MRRRRNRRRVVVALSDLHCGLRLALLNPATVLLDANGDEWTPSLTATQRYLWDVYQGHVRDVADLANGDPVILLLHGDMTQGLIHWSGVWGTRLYDHIVGAVACLDPWVEVCNVQAVRLALGTEAHTHEGTSEYLIARELSATQPKCNIGISQHYRLTVGQAVLDIAHHGPGAGIRQWTTGNVARHYLKSLMLEEIVNQNAPPDVVIRGHVHQWVRETVYLETRAGTVTGEIVVTPGYCGINPFARKITRSSLTQTHGLAAIEVDGDRVQVHKLTRMLDVRKAETL